MHAVCVWYGEDIDVFVRYFILILQVIVKATMDSRLIAVRGKIYIHGDWVLYTLIYAEHSYHVILTFP